MSQTAPAVSLSGDVDRRWLIGTRLGAALAVLGTCGWWCMLWHQGAANLTARASVPLATLFGAAGAWRLASIPPWTLQWNGAQWTFGAPSTPLTLARASIAIDLDRWLLLRIDAGQQRHWLALSRADHRLVWHSLRCALYCARPTAVAHTEPSPGAPDRAA